MKYLITVSFIFLSIVAFAQQKQGQYLLIIRSKVSIDASKEVIQSNIDHWTTWMTGLGTSGKLAGGYRPGNDGLTLTGKEHDLKKGTYTANGETVSSIIIINATDLNEAKNIAANCPVFELQGSVEIRPL